MKGTQITLRALEPEDITFLYTIENNIANWEVSETKIPFSRYLLHEYIKTINYDITQTKQLRLVIEENKTKKSIGLIDLFDFDSINKRSSIGIIVELENRQCGIASEALSLIINYCKYTLNLHQLYCDIQKINTVSIKFFEKNGFVKTGEKKDWILKGNTFSDVYFYQKRL
jgi:diamine N-acetyltransferase